VPFAVEDRLGFELLMVLRDTCSILAT
jgi:hypothetical protein